MHWLSIGSCSRCSGSFRSTNQCRLAMSRSCRHRESCFNSRFLFNSFNYTFLLLNIAKASSREKQLKLYKGNWATIEIMKTLLKNRRIYRSQIGTADDNYNTVKKEGSEDEKGDHKGSDSDSWDNMYQADKERRSGIDESDNGEDGGEAKGNDSDDGIDGEDNSEDGDEDMGADNGDEGGSEDGKESNGSCGVSGRKVDEGKKRKNRDDEPVTRVKRMKRDVSGGHQAAIQPRKKLLLRKKGKKSD